MRFAVSVFVLISPFAFGADCYTDCSARFPKWYQAPDRARCNTEKTAACTKPSELPSPTDHSRWRRLYEEVSDRLIDDFQERGYVVSRKRNGDPEHQGDSALWTAIAMGSLPCDKGQIFQDALIESLARHDGRFERIDPLPESYVGNETSRDME